MTEPSTTEDDPDVEVVLDHLRNTRAFDFTGYKRGTLTRRIRKRMETVGVEDPVAYVDYLEVHPDEFEPLFNTILINVTSFFRDAEAWATLRDRVVPDILEAAGDGPIRVWSAGCSSGQEAYSTVMLFADAIGVDGVRERLKVYATDIDEEALSQARQATYRGRELESLPAEMVEKYFEDTPAGKAFSSDLRRVVIFGRHDLLQDAPISRVDLLLCRNTLMYFNSDAQQRLVTRLHYSLAPHGYLLVGKVEMLLGQGDLFESVDVKRRLFRKIVPPTVRGRLLAMAGSPSHILDVQGLDELIAGAFEHGPDARLVLDDDDLLVAINARARQIFGVRAEYVGRPFQDLELSYRPVELRSAIDQARSEGTTVHLSDVGRWTPAGEFTYLDIAVAPLGNGGDKVGVAISFVDVTQHHRLQEELEQTNRELEIAYEELQSANEELETTNEELQSTIEELETTNEELQSTNEELETMNEELSSTNEELHAINDELRDRTMEVDQVNAYLESVLVGLEASVIVVDTEMLVRVWNGRSFEMWGVRAEEAEGRPLLSLDIGFPVASLSTALTKVIAGNTSEEPIVVEAMSRRGHTMTCAARVTRLTGPKGVVEGAIVLIEEVNGDRTG
jgi:two-component system CheB/CheR fusion protein